MGRQDAIVELFYGGAWHAAPAYVRDPITITRGYRDEGGEATASTADLTLDNRSGDYNPRNAASSLYGLIGRNTPIRVGLSLAVESFGGTSASGWTPADTGQAWSGMGAAAADFTESAGLGRHLQPLKNIVRISLLTEDRRDVEQVTETSIPAVALGASAVVGHVARYDPGTNTYYWLRLELDVGGAVTAKISRTVSGSFTELAVLSGIPGLTYTAGQSYSLRSSVCGSRLSLRVWPTGTAEPSGWTLTAFDSTITAAGRYGLASWVVAGNTNTTEVRFDSYEAVDRRCVLEVASWKPGRSLGFNPAAGRGDAWTEVEAAGILRRLGQGTAPSYSPLQRTIAGSGPVAYYPAEDGMAATAAGSAVSGQSPLAVTGTVEFKPVEPYSYNTATVRYGTSALADLAAGGSMSASLGGAVVSATSGAWTVQSIAKVDTTATSGDVVLLQWATPGGTHTRWQLLLGKASGRTQVIAYTSAGTATVVVDRAGIVTSFETWMVSAEQVGGNINVTYWLSETIPITGSVAGTLGGVESLAVNTTGATSSIPMPVGHLAVWGTPDVPYPTAAFFDSYGEAVAPALQSHKGEAATDRLVRVAAEAGVTVEMPPVSADAVIRMGWQPVATLTTLLTQCVDVDMGLLYEPRDALSLAYRPRESLYNQAPKLTIDYAVGEVKPPFAPVVDDQRTRNDITVKRTDGSSARAVQTSGPLAAIPAEDGGVGVYATNVELNVADDSRLADIAGWLLHKGTVDEVRFARLTVDLVDSPGLAAAAAAADVGDLAAVVNLPADVTPDDASLLALGYVETVGSHTRTVTFTAAPGSPYTVATVDGEPRVVADGSTLAASLTSTALSLSLASTAANGVWTTNPADFPLDIRVGGERVTVSAITGTISPQPAAISARSVNGVVKAWPAGTEVDVWTPAIVAL